MDESLHVFEALKYLEKSNRAAKDGNQTPLVENEDDDIKMLSEFIESKYKDLYDFVGMVFAKKRELEARREKDEWILRHLLRCGQRPDKESIYRAVRDSIRPREEQSAPGTQGA